MIGRFLDHISKIELDSESIDGFRNFILLSALSGSLTHSNEYQLTSEQEKLVETPPDNPPYTLPSCWKWSTIGAVCQHQAGKALNSKNRVGELRPYLSTANVQDGFFDLETIKQMRFKDEVEFQKYSVAPKDVLVLEGGSVGRTAIWEGEPNEYALQNHLHRLRPIENIATPKFIDLVLRTSYRLGQSSSLAKGIAIQGLSAGKLKSLPFPIAPFEEQGRIVEKVDEFMRLLGDVESSQNAKELTLFELRRSALSELAEGEDYETVNETFNRISENANQLFSKPEDIEFLRQSILQLAVQGKLTPRDVNDEPASVLIEMFEEERERLVESKEIRKPKSLMPIQDEEVHFDIPDGWELRRLGDLCTQITKGSTPTTYGFEYQSSGVNFIKVENIDSGRIDHSSSMMFIGEDANEALSRSQLKSGDILFSIAGTIGKTCLVLPTDLPANTNQALGIIRGSDMVFDAQFLQFVLDSVVSKWMDNRARGGAMQNVSLGDITNLPVPIAPRHEQTRIVSNIGELFSLCDHLSRALESKQTIRPILMNSLIRGVLEAQ